MTTEIIYLICFGVSTAIAAYYQAKCSRLSKRYTEEKCEKILLAQHKQQLLTDIHDLIKGKEEVRLKWKFKIEQEKAHLAGTRNVYYGIGNGVEHKITKNTK